MISHEIEISYPEHRILSVYAVPLPGAADDDEPSILVILRDVTSEREQEASALEGERQSAVKQLAAGVAHEIGNPLNALNIHLQLLSRELRNVEDEEMRGNLTELVDVAKNDGYYYSQQLIDAYGPATTLLLLGIILSVLTLLKTATYFGGSAMLMPLRTGVIRDIRQDLGEQPQLLGRIFFHAFIPVWTY